MIAPLTIRHGQHPDTVAASCVRLADRWAGRPEVILLTRQLLSVYSPVEWDTSGRWVPAALLDWARSITYYREPGWHGELVQALPWTVAVGGGDCDDIATAQATMASTLGIPAAIGRVWTSPATAHITCAVGPSWLSQSPDEWLLVDPENTEPLPVSRTFQARWWRVGVQGGA